MQRVPDHQMLCLLFREVVSSQTRATVSLATQGATSSTRLHTFTTTATRALPTQSSTWVLWTALWES